MNNVTKMCQVVKNVWGLWGVPGPSFGPPPGLTCPNLSGKLQAGFQTLSEAQEGDLKLVAFQT